jgi:hypothetical protein
VGSLLCNSHVSFGQEISRDNDVGDDDSSTPEQERESAALEARFMSFLSQTRRADTERAPTTIVQIIRGKSGSTITPAALIKPEKPPVDNETLAALFLAQLGQKKIPSIESALSPSKSLSSCSSGTKEVINGENENGEGKRILSDTLYMRPQPLPAEPEELFGDVVLHLVPKSTEALVTINPEFEHIKCLPTRVLVTDTATIYLSGPLALRRYPSVGRGNLHPLIEKLLQGKESRFDKDEGIQTSSQERYISQLP